MGKRDEVREELAMLVMETQNRPMYDVADQILAIEGLAVVDRDARLPENPMFNVSTIVEFGAFVRKEGWVKEVSDG